MNSLQKYAVCSALFCGCALPSFGRESAKEWWAALTMGADPIYRQIELPEEALRSFPKPLFDEEGRLWTSESAPHLFDGFRWQRFELDEGLEAVGTRHYDEATKRLWLADASRFGYVELGELGYPLDKTVDWLAPFPEMNPGATPWFAGRYAETGGLRFVLGGDLYVSVAGTVSKVIDTDNQVLFPFTQGGRVGWGDEEGVWNWIHPAGTVTKWSHPEIDSMIHWMRENHSTGVLEGASDRSTFRVHSRSKIETIDDAKLGALLREGWSVGSVQSEAGWTASMTHTSDMLIYPADSLKPYAAPSPRINNRTEPSRINQAAFDKTAKNLWLATMQGLYKWENPGLAWRWVDPTQSIKRLKTGPRRMLAIGSTSAFHLNLSDFTFDQISDQADLFLDATKTPESYLFASREHVYSDDGASVYLPAEIAQDLLFILPVEGSAKHFVTFGQNDIFLGALDPEGEHRMTAVAQLNSPVTSAIRVGNRYYYSLSDGAVFELILSADTVAPEFVSKTQLRASDGGSRTRTLTAMGDTLLFISNGELAVFDRSTQAFSPIQFPVGAAILAATELDPTTALCVLSSEGSTQTFYATFETTSSSPTINYFWYPGDVSVGQIADIAYVPETEHVFLGGSKGLVSFQRDLLKPFEKIAPFRLEASLDNGATWTRFESDAPRLPYDTSQVQFRWYQPHWYLNAPVQFESQLGGVHTAWTTSEVAEREFTGLREGNYSFKVRTQSPIGTTLHAQAFDFLILPPWYRSTPAYVAYFILLLIAGYVGARLYSFRETLRRAHLARVVKRRTAELEQANKTKAEFVASMSHELRNPINGVIGISELLERSTLPEESKGLVTTLRSCTAQLSSMIDDVLDFARIESGHLTLQKRPFNLPALINRVVEVTHWDARQSSHEVHLISEGTAPALVIGDDSKISQILINFINNACKYTEPGEIHLRVRCEVLHHNRLSLGVFVEDAGPGLSSEERARIFEKFYRSPRAANSSIRGTGLGLSVCREIAELMGGEVSVSSNQRGGSTFSLSLSLYLPENGAIEAPEDFEVDYIGSALVVDDMDYNRLVATGLLESLGFSVTSVSTGRKAIEYLIGTDYDFAFLDYELTDSTGPQILRQVKREKPHFATKCFAVTAYTTEEVKRRCIEAGFRGHISKPISRIRLHEALIGSGLHPRDLARGSYRQAISDTTDQTFDLEPLLLLAGGSMSQLMDRCEEYISILHTEMASLEQLVEDDLASDTLVAKELHRLISHATIVKAQAFIAQIEAMQATVKSTPSENWSIALESLSDGSRELALNLRRIVDEYRSNG